MKTLLLILTLEAASLLACAQGTITFANNTVTWIGVTLPDGTEWHATAEDGLLIGAFYGPAGSSADSLVLAPGLATIGPIPGVMINASSVFPIPGTELGQVVSLQSGHGTPPLAPMAGAKRGPTAQGVSMGRRMCANTHSLRPPDPAQ